MTIGSLSTGRATAGQVDSVVAPLRRPYRNPAVYLHGSGSAASEAMGAGVVPSIRRIVADVAAAGFPVGGPTAPNTWGNATGRSRLGDVASWLRTAHLAPNDDLVLIGASHGTTWAFDYAIANPDAVACIVAILPIVDLTAVRDGDVLGLRAGIDTAWGVAHPAALPEGADPSLNTEDLDGIPIQLWYASDDPVSVNLAAFASATGAELHNVGALGHTDAAIAAVDRAAVVEFIREAVA